MELSLSNKDILKVIIQNVWNYDKGTKMYETVYYCPRIYCLSTSIPFTFTLLITQEEIFSSSSLSLKALHTTSYASCLLRVCSSFAVSKEIFSNTKALITVRGGSARIIPGAITSFATTFLTVRFSIRDGLSSP